MMVRVESEPKSPSLGTWAVAVALALGLAACANDQSSVAAPQRTAAKPNILLIVADDLGYSDLGAYGGEIGTPNLDALAAEGRILTSHYASPVCSPTRAMLLSGADSHLVGLGTMGEVLTDAQRGKPGYEGYLNDRALYMPTLLRDAGYHSYMVGKWHLGRTPETDPKARGFELSFAQLQGAGSHFAPVKDKPIAADSAQYRENGKPATLPPDYYSSDFLTSKLIDYIDTNKADGKPFFAYAAYTAPHWPLHARDDDIRSFKGRYDAGYDAIRQARIERQKALGLLPVAWKPNPGVPAGQLPTWSQLSPQQRALEARKMEVYAAMVHSLDRNIGRLLQHLKRIGAYDNTLIVFMSDNGAEGGKNFFPNTPHTDNSLENIGRPLSNATVSARWAEVSATPFRLFKGYPTEGGIVVPAIVRLPGQQKGGAMVQQVTHVTDVLPTFLAAAGIPNPGHVYAGRNVHPISGVSLLPVLDGRRSVVRAPGSVLAGELFGSRYVRRDQWKLVSVTPPFGDSRWQLFDMDKDRGEINDLAAAQPEIVSQLTQEWNRYERDVGLVPAPYELIPTVP